MKRTKKKLIPLRRKALEDSRGGTSPGPGPMGPPNPFVDWWDEFIENTKN